ncbi:MAG: hypothetical protein GXP25_17315 [Planctomycetes bacterium]|nr:hypothetical protein [Planctomycetota bacterium]
MLTVKRVAIAVILLSAFGAYYRHTNKPCPMCKGEGLIRCESCDGKGIVKVRIISVPNGPPEMERFFGISRHMMGERRKKLKTPIEKICSLCKGTGKCRCPACESRVKFDFNKNDEPIRRYIYTKEGDLIRTEDIDPSTLPKLKPAPQIKQIEFVQ